MDNKSISDADFSKILLLGVNLAIESIDQKNVYDAMTESKRSKDYINGYKTAVQGLHMVRESLNEKIRRG